MPKLPFMKWYPNDWINDTRSLSAQAKGCWIDILCLMWNTHQRGVWEGTYQEFARVTGIPWEEASAIIAELSKVSRVTKRDSLVTLENRRMVRVESSYKSHANRQSEYRKRRNSDALVTGQTLDVRRHKRLTSTSYATPLAPLGGASATRETEGNGAIVKKDCVGQKWFNTSQPRTEFEYDQFIFNMTQVERTQSKLREKFMRKELA